MDRADLLIAWHDHLALSLRRSPHTVRAYHRTAQRLLDALPPEQDWASLARLDATRLRQHLAERRADGLVNTSAARELSALKAFLAFARTQAGLPDAAFAPGRPAVTDGISIDIFETTPGGLKRLIYHRLLDPARILADRGPQKIEVDQPEPFSGDLIFRFGNGPANDPTNDWAYWAGVEIK